MCGRYTLTAGLKPLQKRFGFAEPRIQYKPRYNVAPNQLAPVVINEKGRRLEMFRWGLIPSWSKDPSVGNKMVNARGETLLEKPSFKSAFEKRRCLILADGFYEWKHIKGTKNKVPYRAVLKSREPFGMAGLWESWKASDGTVFKTFTIVTTSANEALKDIHERMPVILRPADEGRWLDPESRPEDLASLLSPSTEPMEPYTVAPIVNTPDKDEPSCINPAAPPGDPQLKLF